MLEQKFFYNMFLIIKAKYYVVVSLYWTPLLEPLSVLLPPLQITNEFTYLNSPKNNCLIN